MHVNLNLYSISYFLLIIAFIYSMYAQSKIATVYSKYFSVPSKKGMTGMQVARDMLDRHGFYDVKINSIPGTLTDHYDPRTKEMNLSKGCTMVAVLPLLELRLTKPARYSAWRELCTCVFAQLLLQLL